MVKKKQIKLFHTEEFKFEKVKDEDGKEEIIISGNAMPLGKMSRNKVFYRPESVKKAYKTLEGVAFLNGHDPTQSLGHVQEVGLTKTHVTYRANIDPEEKNYLRKSERGDIRHVSVGCMVDAIEFMEDGTVECDVTEFVELSAVAVPGFSDTSAEREGLSNLMLLTEKFGTEEQLKNIVEKYKDDEEEADDEKDKDEEDDDDKEKEAEDDDKDKDEADDSDDDDEEDDDKDDEEDEGKEADDDDDDKDKEKDDEDDEGESDSEDDEDSDEEGDKEDDDEEDDSKEKLEDKKEDAGQASDDSEAEESMEEKLAKTMARTEELFSKFDEMTNRLAIIEASIDAINDTEEDAEADEDNSEELEPSKEEKFIDEKDKAVRGKKDAKAKEKVLTGENSSKKINGEKEVVDMNKVRLKNVSY